LAGGCSLLFLRECCLSYCLQLRRLVKNAKIEWRNKSGRTVHVSMARTVILPRIIRIYLILGKSTMPTQPLDLVFQKYERNLLRNLKVFEITPTASAVYSAYQNTLRLPLHSSPLPLTTFKSTLLVLNPSPGTRMANGLPGLRLKSSSASVNAVQ